MKITYPHDEVWGRLWGRLWGRFWGGVRGGVRGRFWDRHGGRFEEQNEATK